MRTADLREPVRMVDAAAYRNAIGHLASGVTIIMTSHDGNDVGATASAVCCLSTDPAMLIVCLNRASATGRAVREARRLSVNILAEDQARLASRFGSRHPDKFRDVPLDWSEHSIPRLADALVSIDARVEFAVEAATHAVFICDVDHVEVRPGRPLAYFRGRFGAFAEVENEVLRQRVLDTLRTAPDQAYDPRELAARLEAQAASVADALAQLAGRGLAVHVDGRYRSALTAPGSTNQESTS